MKQNKYINIFVLQANYGYGWDDLTTSDNWGEIKTDKRAYARNDTAPLRIIKRRVLNAQ